MLRTRLPTEVMQVLFLGVEGPLEKEMATRSSHVTYETPWTEESGGLWSMEVSKESDKTW